MNVKWRKCSGPSGTKTPAASRIRRKHVDAPEVPISIACQAFSFDDELDMCRLVAKVELDTPEDLAAFVRWRDLDGTKEGLLELFERCFRRRSDPSAIRRGR